MSIDAYLSDKPESFLVDQISRDPALGQRSHKLYFGSYIEWKTDTGEPFTRIGIDAFFSYLRFDVEKIIWQDGVKVVAMGLSPATVNEKTKKIINNRKRVGRMVQDDEINAVLATCGDTAVGWRDRAMFQAEDAVGFRIEEMSKFKLEHIIEIDDEVVTIKVVGGRGDLARAGAFCPGSESRAEETDWISGHRTLHLARFSTHYCQ